MNAPTAGGRRWQVLLAGNPNTGKSTLFNRLTGGRARTGNYPGVTVSPLVGTFDTPAGRVEVTDLPGTYSLVGRSPEEQLAIDRIAGLHGHEPPDLVVVCADATNLLRNLYLVLQIQELGRHVLLALTMIDEAGDAAPDPRQLRRVLGCRVVPVNARSGEGVEALRRAIGAALEAPDPVPPWRWTPSEGLRAALDRMAAALGGASDGVALWALMSLGDDELVGIPDAARRVAAEIGGRFDDEVVQARYAWLDRAVGGLEGKASHGATDRADRVLLHPVWGLAIFAVLMAALFQGLFTWSDPAIAAIEAGVSFIGAGVAARLPEGLLASFLVDGILAGVGSVVVFLPQIVLLFFLLSVMEDTGYMARVAYLMDRLMRPLGLHGRAFVPMLSGFACAVPAILATRTMERRRDRFLTMMVIPLMTCSARLPVYTLIIAALFPAGRVLGVFPTQGLMMMAMYAFSVVIAMFAGFVLSRTILRAPAAPLVLELPPYRRPRLVDVWRRTWHGARHFLKDAGTIIFVCAVIMWGLLTFPRVDPEAVAGLSDDEAAAFQVSHSYAGRLGRTLEPVIAPLGFDWKIGVGLVGAFAAREVFVSTMGTVYALGADEDEQSLLLRERMRQERRANGRPTWTPLVGVSLMVFIALAAQCMSTLAVLRRETRSWRWPAFLFVYMTALAWVGSFLVYQGGRLLGLG